MGEKIKPEKSRSGQSFISGVLVLTAANLISKVIGLIFKIPLTNMLGNEGMGYFNTAYQIYTWLYMISTAGLPVALSLMISEYNAQGKGTLSKRIFRLTLTVFAVLGLIGSVLMFFLCKGLAAFISADLSYLCILSIAPAFFFICVTSTVRGYFQGNRNMVPTAVSEILESLGKLGIGIALGSYALSKGYPIHKVAAYSIFGVTVGVIAGAVFLVFSAVFSKMLGRKTSAFEETFEEHVSNGRLFGTFLKIAVPIMISSSLLSMSSMMDTLIVIRRLQDFGLAENAAVALYGNYTAYCVTLFNLPSVLIYPIVNALIPSLSAARASGSEDRTRLIMLKSLKLASVIALPCTFGLAAMSKPILTLIFSSAENAEMAAPLLSALAPSVFLIGVLAVTNGVLQACKLQKYSLISMLMGALIKGVSAYFLVGLPIGDGTLGMYASPISTFLFYLTITVMNFYFIVRYAGIRVPVISIFIRPFAAAVGCVAFAVAVYGIFGTLIGFSGIITLASIAVAALVYAVLLLIFGGITKEDLRFIPKAEKLLEISLFKRVIREK